MLLRLLLSGAFAAEPVRVEHRSYSGDEWTVVTVDLRQGDLDLYGSRDGIDMAHLERKRFKNPIRRWVVPHRRNREHFGRLVAWAGTGTPDGVHRKWAFIRLSARASTTRGARIPSGPSNLALSEAIQ